MNNTFIETANTRHLTELCDELISPVSLIGPSLAMVTGPAGRGKTEAARHYAVHRGCIYIPPMNTRTPTMLLREIAFELQNIRPAHSEACVLAICEGMAINLRLILIDEADLLPLHMLEMLRNLNERCACPIMLIGEETLKGKIGGRRRLLSRMRHKMEFAPISREDIVFFFHAALNVKIGASVTALIHKHANGDWRPVLTTAIGIERTMKASSAKEITEWMVKDVIKHT